ncbi:peptidoglycan/LPS O-acetylase OafA/YrhL [Rahnella sp. BIGb0236]|uniref:acyltransferase family protein n=1 Tax=Rahnella sp. BIGb0236 TaxID=2485117 RepID=UPI00105CBB20|nr:acyltransferase [Rahnella sp. BIGb0236]TDS87840.1 peptidoglycan/LPS O-acetylase OafA/YrhL [Rahnella sp. BIGb0236]VTQ61197.1 Acyltransferase family [Campylobacter jejuni]
MNNKITSIHYLRGVAALLVVFFHFRFYLNDAYSQKDLGSILFGGGAFGVDLFFMISGFIISLSTERNTSTFVFITRRFFRIYPAFLVTFSIGALFVFNSYSNEQLLRAMFFLHKDYTLESPSFGYNILGPAWTLTYEIYFYLTFVIAMLTSHKYRVILSSGMILVPIIIIQLYYTGGLTISGNGSPKIPFETEHYELIRFISSPIMIEFIIGMLFFEAYKRVNLGCLKTYSKHIISLCFGLFLFLYFSPSRYGFGLQGFGIWALILISGSLIYEKNNKINYSATLSFLGDISYSLYMSHYLVINSLDFYRFSFWTNSTGISKFFLATTICISIAFFMYYWVEKPFIYVGKFIESTIKKRNGKAIQL